MTLEKLFQEPVGMLRLQKNLVGMEQEPVSSIVRQMIEFRSSCVLIIKNQSQPCGIFSECDFVKKVLAEGLPPSKTLVKDVMSPNPVMIKATTNVGEAMKIMSRNNIHHIPVLNKDSSVLGILSVFQIMELVASYFPQEINSPWHIIKKNDTVW